MWARIDTMKIAAIVILAVGFYGAEANELWRLPCDYNITALNTNADYIIGAVLPITELGKNLAPAHTILWVQAIIYATEKISKDSNLLPGITLGYAIHDSCHSNVDVITNHGLEFITNNDFYFNTTGASYSPPQCLCREPDETKLAAVIGTSTDETSEIMAKIILTNSLPLISPSALSDSMEQNDNFVRTSPSHTQIIKAIVDFVIKLNWTYVSALAYDNIVGRTDMSTLRNELKSRNACLALEYLFDEQTNFDSVIEVLRAIQSKSEIVILWSSIERGLKIVDATAKANLSITWVTLWEADTYVKHYPSLLGSFTVEQTDVKVDDFTNYLNTLKLATLRNPWLEKFWVQIDPLSLFFNPSSMLAQKHTDSVLATVYTIAHGLHKALDCNDKYCKNQNKKLNYNKLLQSMRQASFLLNNQTYKLSDPLFNKIYNIKQVQINKRISTPGKIIYRFVDIAQFTGKTRTVVIDQSKIRWENRTMPKGVCSRDCIRGEKQIKGSSPCCWQCLKCVENSISTELNQKQCVTCSLTTYANNESSKCLPLVNINIKLFSATTERVLLTLNVFGTLCTLFVIVLFFNKWNTPIVKSSNREMSIIQLTALLLLFWLPMLYYPTLTVELCIAQNFTFGVLDAIILSIIVIKTHRLLRVFRERRFSKVSKYLQNRYQITLVLIPIVLLIVYTAVWYQIYSVEIGIERYMSEMTYVWYCKAPETNSAGDIENHIILFCIIAYLFILSLCAGYMAFRARKLPENFNEAQFIFYAMFTSSLIWVLFIFIYLSQNQEIKPIAFLLISTINTFCMLLILYGYKVVIMIFYPHWNTKSHFQKLAKNAKVVTYIQDGLDPNDKRPSKVSVISFDFDTMFRDYNNMKNNPAETTKKSSHFPSTILKRLSTIRKSKRVTRSFRRQRSKLTDETFNDVKINPSHSRGISRQITIHNDDSNEDTDVTNTPNVEVNSPPQRVHTGKDSIVSAHSFTLLLSQQTQRRNTEPVIELTETTDVIVTESEII